MSINTVIASDKWAAFRKWFSRVAVIALGAAAPQLCGLIPNPIASKLCGVVVHAVVVTVDNTAKAPDAPPPPPPPPVEDCAPERRLSTGKCLP